MITYVLGTLNFPIELSFFAKKRLTLSVNPFFDIVSLSVWMASPLPEDVCALCMAMFKPNADD